jgi:hypothetical protein
MLLFSCQCSILRLCLRLRLGSELSHENAAALAEALKHNQRIQSLYIGNDHLVLLILRYRQPLLN